MEEPGLHDARAAVAWLRGLPGQAERAAAATALLEQLGELERAVSAVRDEAVRGLRAGGASYGTIAAAAGLTRTRVVQLLQRQEEDGDPTAAPVRSVDPSSS